MRALPLLLACLWGVLAGAPRVEAARIRDRVDILERDLRELRDRLAESEARRERLIREVEELRRAIGVDQPGHLSPADLAARLDSIDTDVRVLFENQNEMSRRLAVMGEKVDVLYEHQLVFGAAGEGAEGEPGLVAADPLASAAEGPEGMSKAGAEGEPAGLADGGDEGWPGEASSDLPPPGMPVDPQELFGTARADLGRGANDLAIEGFEEFLRLFPASELADDALYWIGEARLGEGLLSEAQRAFEQVLDAHPDGDKAPDAGLKRGLCLLEQNRTADGIIQLQAVKESYPGTAAARLARQKLESLGLM